GQRRGPGGGRPRSSRALVASDCRQSAPQPSRMRNTMRFITDKKYCTSLPRRSFRATRDRLAILALAVLAACRGVDAGPPEPDPGVPEAAERGASRAGLHASPAPGAARRSAVAAAAGAPLPIPTSTQFDITGFLQEAHT